MATEIKMPKMGMTMKDARIVSWTCKEGDRIEVGQEIYVIETAKVTYEIEALDSGFLRIMAQPGDVVEVGESVGQLAADEEELAALQSKDGVPSRETATDSKVSAANDQVMETQINAGPIERPKSVRITPKARRLADEKSFDYSLVKGSGPGGRIKYDDIVAALKASPAASSRGVAVSPESHDDCEMINGMRVKKIIPLEGLRLGISEHMMRSLQGSAQLTTMSEVNMVDVIRFREKLLAKGKESGVRVTYTDILVFILARILRKVPIMNSSLIDGQITVWEDVNIGVATAFDRGDYDSGLLVPVVKNADHKSLSEINKEIKELSEKVRTGKIAPDDMSGGTFTLSNTGMLHKEWVISTPVINQPQSAIMQTSAIIKRVEEIDGQFVSVPVMPFSLTFDHRLLDGVPVAKFIRYFTEILQDMELLMF